MDNSCHYNYCAARADGRARPGRGVAVDRALAEITVSRCMTSEASQWILNCGERP